MKAVELWYKIISLIKVYFNPYSAGNEFIYTFANSVHPDQKAPRGALWSEVYSVCYIWIITEIYPKNSYRLAVVSKLEQSILKFSALRVKKLKFQFHNLALKFYCFDNILTAVIVLKLVLYY